MISKQQKQQKDDDVQFLTSLIKDGIIAGNTQPAIIRLLLGVVKPTK